ncbi:thioredoxin family protein [Virgibacillus litoralis]|uniref:Thiol-disulfide isomerase/thioredoxin n=1 Tax=Virgibacillus litoralis TaxID=578221 RepID=A0ABS4HGV4_9BACI|nr:thioredoxin family protein [Virgibacillus litoralis]MBP1950136.1 thiol-disulfide isomerase/thioredoxin [Virgibacillus litoralis]
MQQISEEQLEKEHYLLYIYTPFCGTCALAKSMLDKIESVHKQDIFYDMNASLYPEFMQNNQIESVPCLLIKDGNEIKEKIYAFKSIANIYSYLMEYEPSLFSDN